MAFSEEDRAAFGASVPAYVEAAEDGTFRVVETASGEVLSSEHATAKTALNSALELDSVQPMVKSANLRTEGEPDGEWRWLDATAVEDQPIGGARIGELSIWEMASSLNTRSSAIPINGGGAPDGMQSSDPHGDAANGGDHPANGFAHVGIPVMAADGRAHLYLFGELLPEVAAEVDRGRLAYGSVYFGFDDVDEADNEAVQGAQLISHALTNDPAVTTLSAGSERRRLPSETNSTRRAGRSAWRKASTVSDKIKALLATARNTDAPEAERRGAVRQILAAARGPITDTFSKVADVLGVSVEERADNPWALEDAIFQFEMGAKAEQRLESIPAPAEEPPAEEAAEVAAERPPLDTEARTSLLALSKRGHVFGLVVSKREVEGLEGEELDAFAQSMLDLGRIVLSKPEATPGDVVAELEAREDEIIAALEEPTEEPEEDGEATEEAGEAAASSDLRSRFGKMRSQRNKARSALAVETAKVAKFETYAWLDAELAKREKTVTPQKRDRYVAIALKSGREVVAEFLDDLNSPPQGLPMGNASERSLNAVSDAPENQDQAYDACMDDAKKVCEEREAKAAERQGRKPRDTAREVIRSAAQKLANERYPGLFD